MKLTIVSAFRNAEGYIERYCDQMDDLQKLLTARGDSLLLILGYGDSDDQTAAMLYDECLARFDCRLMDVSHGGRYFASIEDAQRFKQLAYVGNQLWRQIPKTSGHDAAALVESDLCWHASTLVCLLDDLAGFPVVAPMVFDSNPPTFPASGSSPSMLAQAATQYRFYDVYAFRRNGKRFVKDAPYYPEWHDGERFVGLDSAGSVLFMRSEVACGLVWPEEDVVVGVCRSIIEKGYSIWLDAKAEVFHP